MVITHLAIKKKRRFFKNVKIENMKASIKNILKYTGFPAISIYIPTEAVGDPNVNRIRWKNEIAKVKTKLVNKDFLKMSILKEAEKLENDISFWQNQSSALVGYFSHDIAETFALDNKITPQNYVMDFFVMAPHLVDISQRKAFFLLTVSRNQVKLFRNDDVTGELQTIKDFSLPDLNDTLNLDIQKETLHGAKGTQSSTNNFKDKLDVRLVQFFKIIDDQLIAFLAKEEAPLIFAGVEGYFELFKEISSYKNIAKEHILGNVDNLTTHELNEKVKKLEIEKLDNESSTENQFSKMDIENRWIDKLARIQLLSEAQGVETLFLAKTFHQSPITMASEKIIRNSIENNVEIKLNNQVSTLACKTKYPINEHVF